MIIDAAITIPLSSYPVANRSSMRKSNLDWKPVSSSDNGITTVGSWEAAKTISDWKTFCESNSLFQLPISHLSRFKHPNKTYFLTQRDEQESTRKSNLDLKPCLSDHTRKCVIQLSTCQSGFHLVSLTIHDAPCLDAHSGNSFMSALVTLMPLARKNVFNSLYCL